jgi:hypothetical protein
MKNALHIIGSAAVTAALGMGASALPANATAGAAMSSYTQTSSHYRHDVRDTNRHDTRHGWFDKDSRWHDFNDDSGWRDDNGYWRADNDHNGYWTGQDGCRHDKNGYWDHNGHRHDSKKHHPGR